MKIYKGVIRIYKDIERKELIKTYEIDFTTIKEFENYYAIAQLNYRDEYVVASRYNYVYSTNQTFNQSKNKSK